MFQQQGPYHGQQPNQWGPNGPRQQGPPYAQQGFYGQGPYGPQGPVGQGPYGPPVQQMGPMGSYGGPPPGVGRGPQYSPAGGLEMKNPNEQENIMGLHQPSYIRNDFIRKVYCILTAQLLVTFAIAYYINTVVGREWALHHQHVFTGVSLVTLGTVFAVSCCCNGLMRTFPTNYLFLSIITVGISIITSYGTLFYSAQAVTQAVLATGFIFAGLTAYACLTKTDFTGLGPYLYGALLCLICFPMVLFIFSLFGLDISTVGGISIQTIMAFFGVLVFTFYIIYDTQLIVGGSHTQYQFSIDDYCFAALNLYLDIINLFLNLLQLLGDNRQ